MSDLYVMKVTVPGHNRSQIRLNGPTTHISFFIGKVSEGRRCKLMCSDPDGMVGKTILVELEQQRDQEGTFFVLRTTRRTVATARLVSENGRPRIAPLTI